MSEEIQTGRPSELADTLITANEYLMGGYENVGEVIPTIAGLACYAKKARSRIYEYAKQSDDFKDILEGILRLQESKLLNKGLTGEFNPTITKLILTKHGYSDKSEIDLANRDGMPFQTISTITSDPNVAAQIYADLMKAG